MLNMSDMKSEYGLREEANPDRELTIKLPNGVNYHRYPVRVPMVSIGDSYTDLVKTYAIPHYKEGDFLVFSEKVISICQKRVVHESSVQPTWLAKLICRFVTKYPNDVGFENPRKMQVAINEAGYPRMIAAVVLGGFMKYFFRQRGWFYRIAGNGIAAIDGFNPIAVPPFNEYAILGPANPDDVCQEIEDAFGVPCIIVDASNVATQILGKSSSFTDVFNLKDQALKEILLGNPMGQGREQTPMLLVRHAQDNS